MNNKLVISDFYDGHLLGFSFIDNQLMRIQNFDNNSFVGNIYCGYVRDIVGNINAAFVDFYDGTLGFLPLKGLEKVPKTGDKILVQVAGDKVKTKDYLLTWKLNLSERSLALVVGDCGIHISKKITDQTQRNTLKSYLEPLQTSEYGFILRTSSQSCSKEEIVAQAENLTRQYYMILKKFEHAAPKTLILEKNKILKESAEFRQKYDGDIITDNQNIVNLLEENSISVTYNDEEKISLCNKYSLGSHMKEALNRKVWLKSGAYLIIEHTEAMTVIDVNTGKADLHSSREKTFEKINLEAAKEIARQICIRNISGIIIVDFINMSSSESYDNLLLKMKGFVGQDYTRCTVCGFTKLGLMEITRQKQEKPLFEVIKQKETSC